MLLSNVFLLMRIISLSMSTVFPSSRAGGEPIFGDLRLQPFYILIPVPIHVLCQHFVERHVQSLIARRVDVRDVLRQHLVPQRRNIDELCQEIEL